MHLWSAAFGPYVPASSSTPFPGLPLCAPATGVDLTARAKLVAPKLVLIPGGVTGVHVDVLCVPDLSSSPQSVTLGVVLRPLGFVNYNDFRGDVAEADFLFGHLKRLTFSIASADTAKKARATFTDLSRLGDPTRPRLAELCFFAISNLTAGNVVILCSTKGEVAAVTTRTRAATFGDAADDRVNQGAILAGQFLLTGLSDSARKATNRGARAVLGAEPGHKGGIVSPARPWVQRLTRAHQHNGVEIVKEDGTLESGGAIFPRLLYSECRAQELGETSGDQYDDTDPAKGFRVHRGGTLASEWKRFPARISLCQGIRRVRFLFALRAETAQQVNQLELYLHLHETGEIAAAGNNLLGSLDGGGLVDAEGYLYLPVLPTETPGFRPHSFRLPYGLGVWTTAAEAPASQLPPGVLAANRYRVSSEVEVAIADDVTLEDKDYTLEVRIAVYDTSALSSTAVDDGARLVWAGAYVPGERAA
jgi:hypothetical protein